MARSLNELYIIQILETDNLFGDASKVETYKYKTPIKRLLIPLGAAREWPVDCEIETN